METTKDTFASYNQTKMCLTWFPNFLRHFVLSSDHNLSEFKSRGLETSVLCGFQFFGLNIRHFTFVELVLVHSVHNDVVLHNWKTLYTREGYLTGQNASNTLRCSRHIHRNSEVCWISINFSRALGALEFENLVG